MYASFLPILALIWEDYSEAQHEEDVRFLKESALKRAGSPADVLAACRNVSTRQHELIHYRQHVGTTLGAFQYRVAVAKLILLGAAATALGPHCTMTNLALSHADVRLALRESGNSDAFDFAMAWHFVDVVAGILWKKGARVGDIRHSIKQLGGVFGTLPMASTADLRITFDLKDDESTEIAGLISVEQISEGLARFRELLVIQEIMGAERSFDLWQQTGSRGSEGTVAFVQDALGIPIHHPLVGAIHDIAISACPDPAAEGEDFEWTRHHPGVQFRRIVDCLREKPTGIIADAWRISIAHDLALEAAGLVPGAIEERYRLHADRLNAGNLQRPRQVVQAGVATLRASVPFVIAYAAELAMHLGGRNADVLNPFAVIQPSIVANPWTTLDRSELLADGILFSIAKQIEEGRGLGSVRKVVDKLDGVERQNVMNSIARNVSNLFPTPLVADIFAKLHPPLSKEMSP